MDIFKDEKHDLEACQENLNAMNNTKLVELKENKKLGKTNKKPNLSCKFIKRVLISS